MSRSTASERRLRDRLRGASPPRAADAERRAWHVVRAAHAARPPARRRGAAVRLALVCVAAVALAAAALSPAGAQVGDWIDDVVSPAPEATSTSLSSLPAAGRLLVVADGGAWVVGDDGARRQLGGFRDATWSPGGLYVAAARGAELVALEPGGEVRWTRAAAGRVTVPRWSPDGYRVAYRSGSQLRVAIGDNTGDWAVGRATLPTAPAWKPLEPPAEQVLAYASGGQVRIVRVDARREVGRTPREPAPREIWWAGTRRLVTVSSRAVRVHGPRGRLLRTVALPRGLEAVGSAMAPHGRRLALIAQPIQGRAASELLVVRMDRATPPRRLLSAPGSFEGLTWSIDGRVIVLGMPEADQWLFVQTGGAAAGVRRGGPGSTGLRSVEHIRTRFAGGAEPRRGSFPLPAGWCRREPIDLTAGQPPCTAGAAR